jgi:Na+/H+ antiporter NhaD/arsenite permease-like protein
MKKISGRAVWGIILIVLGALFLLQELQLVGSAFQFLWIIVSFGAGAAFLWTFASNPQNWWAAIPGLALLGLSITSLEDALSLFPGFELGGSAFLGGLGLSFWLIYFRRQDHWWAIIPGGVLLTLATVAGLDSVGVDYGGGIFFLGLGFTFILVALLPSPGADTRWSYIPALVMLILGFTQLTELGEQILNYWPAILILVGVYILIQAVRK